MSQVIPPTLFCLCRAPDIAAVETIFNDFSYDAVSARDSNLKPPRRRGMRYMLSHDREFTRLIEYLFPES